jgi:hypothetical protein
MSAVRNWLEAIGLGRYADAFEANDIDMDLLAQIDDQMLKDSGVSRAGHRLRIRNAIGKLGPTSTAEPNVASAVAPAEVSASSAARRQLTVMFCDLVGSTALSARLDTEDLRAVIGAYHQAVTRTVAGLDGFVAKYMGDRVLIYFGYPQAHEDDAERAVRAGLELIDAIGRLEIGSTKLQARVGIATGQVVVGDLIGEGPAQGNTRSSAKPPTSPAGCGRWPSPTWSSSPPARAGCSAISSSAAISGPSRLRGLPDRCRPGGWCGRASSPAGSKPCADRR